MKTDQVLDYFQAESLLGPEFSAGWVRRPRRHIKSRGETVRQKIHQLALELYQEYFAALQDQPRSVIMKLQVSGFFRFCLFRKEASLFF